ncbi:BspC domain-containing protein [Paraburkholderia sp. SOS3]|jgi:hypothetical protein|uniref:BspC domain-containing protein n=1 Tax=Paraburkholderia sp. SOS3 TaxID=1926494 RepID=UPI0009476FEF|nr:hypothetical protein [Paraburkholderia sp. SOS3]APR38963.1 hypothetical protein BTO02_26675 [Paraburkholderia sp. SOS3]
MKGFVVPIALTGALLILQAASSHAQDAIPEDYAYLTHINVRPAVINCIAEIDRWIRTATRYDTFLAPDVRLLKAKIRDVDASTQASATQSAAQIPAQSTAQDLAQSIPQSVPQSASQPGTAEPRPSQVDSTVTIHGSARTRKRNAWVPAIARCGFWHSHVVSVTLEPFSAR